MTRNTALRGACPWGQDLRIEYSGGYAQACSPGELRAPNACSVPRFNPLNTIGCRDACCQGRTPTVHPHPGRFTLLRRGFANLRSALRVRVGVQVSTVARLNAQCPAVATRRSRNPQRPCSFRPGVDQRMHILLLSHLVAAGRLQLSVRVEVPAWRRSELGDAPQVLRPLRGGRVAVDRGLR